MKDEYDIAEDIESKFKKKNNYRDTNVKCCFLVNMLYMVMKVK